MVQVVMLGGDIHCGVTSDIHDEDTELSIRHVTTSPVTNHVCKVGHGAGRTRDKWANTTYPYGSCEDLCWIE